MEPATSFHLQHFCVHCFYCVYWIPQRTRLQLHLSYSPSMFGFFILADCRYFGLIRRLVETYTLEPAGSHGVWGLDDTSFLPFLFGSGQLRDEPNAPSTASIMEPEVVQAQKEKNLYFAAIAWINKVIHREFSVTDRSR